MSRGQWTQGSGGGLDTSEVTATADKVLKGYTAGVKDHDEPQEGTLEVQSIVNFKVALYGNLSLIGTWQNPEKGPYSGVMVRYKAESYPVNVNDGVLAYDGANNSCTVSGLVSGVEYYFRTWSYVTTNYGRVYGNRYQEATGITQAVKGNMTYASSGTWTVPANVRNVDVFLVGGGGSGGWTSSKDFGPGGGGGGYTRTYKNIAVTPGQMIAVTVGSSENASHFGSYSAPGGGKGQDGSYGVGGGGSGGSGGGNGGRQTWDGGAGASNGGSNGGGSGQGTTTRAFGESSGTLYSGGGGGGAYRGNGGSGGAGGGGTGAGGRNGGDVSSGATNTGGGGGGGHWNCPGQSGGSGIVLIRWGY